MIETWILILVFKYGVTTVPMQFHNKQDCVNAARNVITVDAKYPQGANDILTYYSGYCVPVKGSRL